MAMSHDRVRFTLTCKYNEREPTIRAAQRAFGLDHEAVSNILDQNCGGGGVVICRPSQFGRFIVYRVNEGVGCNRIKELNPSLILMPNSTVTDVSCNPADSD